MKTIIAAIAIACAAPASVALAAPPWAEGVPSATQDEANKLFDEGNQLFAEQAHAPAGEKYRAALALWDHPLIRFNLAVTLIRLDRPIEAADELDKALRFGEQPFKKELYQQALDYQALLKGRVGYIEAGCTQNGVKIRVDGKPWFDCPGKQTMRVMAGEHIVDGELKDHVPATSGRLVVVGGATAKHDVTMRSVDSAVVLTYKYPRWIPFAILGAGGAIGLGGLAVYMNGRSKMDEFEQDYLVACPAGCSADLESANNTLYRARVSAEGWGDVGLGMMIGGGAILVGGVVFAVINKPTRELPKLDVTPTNGGVAASTTFRF